MLIFNDALIAFDLQAPDAQAVIEALAGRLSALSLVAPDYGAQAWARERAHPTGLPTQPFAIAFPHADASGVTRSALAVALLHQPVTFQNMADPEESLAVHAVFMLANRQPEEQVRTLRHLAELFGQPEKLTELREQHTPQGAVAWLKRELRLDQDGG